MVDHSRCGCGHGAAHSHGGQRRAAHVPAGAPSVGPPAPRRVSGGKRPAGAGLGRRADPVRILEVRKRSLAYGVRPGAAAGPEGKRARMVPLQSRERGRDRQYHRRHAGVASAAAQRNDRPRLLHRGGGSAVAGGEPCSRADRPDYLSYRPVPRVSGRSDLLLRVGRARRVVHAAQAAGSDRAHRVRRRRLYLPQYAAAGARRRQLLAAGGPPLRARRSERVGQVDHHQAAGRTVSANRG